MNYFKFVVYLFVFIVFSSVHAGSHDDFFRAIIRNDPVEIQSLLLRGFDPNTVDSKGRYGLILALQNKSIQIVKVLLDHPDTDPEVRTPQDESPLMLAAFLGWPDICERLISLDADVNKPGWTPLHYAASAGHLSTLQLLLNHHAYIDATSPNGSTPLMMAAMYGSTPSVQLLLDAGADIAVRNDQGLSAIDFATKGHHPDSVEAIAAHLRAHRPNRTEW
jgi:ankyrin repeat protein